MEDLEREFGELQPGPRRNAVLDARSHAETAIAHARTGRPESAAQRQSWVVDPTLPVAERKANERLLDAAPELLAAAKKAYAALAGHVDSPEAVGALSDAISRAAR